MPFKFNPFTQKPDIVDVTAVPPGTVSGLVGDTGGNVGPDVSGDINILGSGDVTVTGDAPSNTLTLAYTGDPIDFLAGDTGGNIGPDGSGVVTLTGGTNIDITGAGNTLTFDFTGTQGTPITPFVVGATGNYATWTDAITAATGTGATIYVQAGTYTENINFNTDAVGLSFVGLFDTNLGSGVILNGQHNPPLSGNTTFQGIYFQNSSAVTSTFTTSSAGSPNIQFINCAIDNSTAPEFISITTLSPNIFMVGCKSIGNTQAIFSVTAGNVYVRDCDFQHSSGSTTFSGTLLTVLNSRFTGALTGNGNMDLQNSFLGVVFNGGSSTGRIYNCYLSSASLAAFAHSSSAAWVLSDLTIETPANPAIDGSGSGGLLIGNINFLSGSNIASTLTVGFGSGQGGPSRFNTTQNLSVFHISSTSTAEPVGISSYNSVANNGANIICRRARGSEGTPTAVQAGDVLCGIYGMGYITSGFSANVCAMRIRANETFSAGNTGAYFDWATTSDGATSRTVRMRLENNGALKLGSDSPPASSAILQMTTTTQAFRLPIMSTTQKDAISSPVAGLMVFDTTLGKACVHSGTAWETITST